MNFFIPDCALEMRLINRSKKIREYRIFLKIVLASLNVKHSCYGSGDHQKILSGKKIYYRIFSIRRINFGF